MCVCVCVCVCDTRRTERVEGLADGGGGHELPAAQEVGRLPGEVREDPQHEVRDRRHEPVLERRRVEDSHTHTHTHTHSLSLTHTHTLSNTHSNTQAHTHTLSLSHIL